MDGGVISINWGELLDILISHWPLAASILVGILSIAITMYIMEFLKQQFDGNIDKYRTLLAILIGGFMGWLLMHLLDSALLNSGIFSGLFAVAIYNWYWDHDPQGKFWYAFWCHFPGLSDICPQPNDQVNDQTATAPEIKMPKRGD